MVNRFLGKLLNDASKVRYCSKNLKASRVRCVVKTWMQESDVSKTLDASKVKGVVKNRYTDFQACQEILYERYFRFFPLFFLFQVFFSTIVEPVGTLMFETYADVC